MQDNTARKLEEPCGGGTRSGIEGSDDFVTDEHDMNSLGREAFRNARAGSWLGFALMWFAFLAGVVIGALIW